MTSLIGVGGKPVLQREPDAQPNTCSPLPKRPDPSKPCTRWVIRDGPFSAREPAIAWLPILGDAERSERYQFLLLPDSLPARVHDDRWAAVRDDGMIKQLAAGELGPVGGTTAVRGRWLQGRVCLCEAVRSPQRWRRRCRRRCRPPAAASARIRYSLACHRPTAPAPPHEAAWQCGGLPRQVRRSADRVRHPDRRGAPLPRVSSRARAHLHCGRSRWMDHPARAQE
jgi:hypothetical protein